MNKRSNRDEIGVRVWEGFVGVGIWSRDGSVKGHTDHGWWHLCFFRKSKLTRLVCKDSECYRNYFWTATKQTQVRYGIQIIYIILRHHLILLVSKPECLLGNDIETKYTAHKESLIQGKQDSSHVTHFVSSIYFSHYPFYSIDHCIPTSWSGLSRD